MFLDFIFKPFHSGANAYQGTGGRVAQHAGENLETFAPRDIAVGNAGHFDKCLVDPQAIKIQIDDNHAFGDGLKNLLQLGQLLAGGAFGLPQLSDFFFQVMDFLVS